MTQPRHSLGDLIRALERLQPDGAARTDVAHALGFELPDVGSSHTSLTGGGPDEPDPRVASQPTPGPEPKPVATKPSETATPVDVRGHVTHPLELQGIVGQGRLLDPPVALPAAPVKPLLRPSWTRALLACLVRRPTGRGAIDLDELIHQVIWRPPLRAIPRATRMSTRLGVQVLVDESDAMAPHAPDQAAVLHCLQRMIPANAIEVVRFYGHPLRHEVHSSRIGVGPYRAPRTGTAVLLLSDLGLGPSREQDREPQHWLRLADEIAGARCFAAALVPVSPTRWPEALTHALAMVYWDNRTAPGDGHRAMRGQA